jgi:hypothetical protein
MRFGGAPNGYPFAALFLSGSLLGHVTVAEERFNEKRTRREDLASDGGSRHPEEHKLGPDDVARPESPETERYVSYTTGISQAAAQTGREAWARGCRGSERRIGTRGFGVFARVTLGCFASFFSLPEHGLREPNPPPRSGSLRARESIEAGGLDSARPKVADFGSLSHWSPALKCATNTIRGCPGWVGPVRQTRWGGM